LATIGTAARSLRNLHQLFDLIRRQRRGEEFLRYGIRHDAVQILDLIGLQRLLRDEF
jgi:hypothetical protein